jgi:glycosyltransferase involved in cell wall biosynthesis
MTPQRLALVTDAWHPQTNGVATTLARVVKYLESRGTEVLVIGPDASVTLPLPSYPEIRIACNPWVATRKLTAWKPDAVHVATEGPLGFWTIGWLRRRGLHFTTSFHTRYPEYVGARLPVPIEWGYKVERWFHGAAQRTMVSTRSLLRELQVRRIGQRLVYWPRGVDADLFHPGRRQEALYDLPRPLWLYVGRVAIEKSIDDFLQLPLPGTKVVVGDGPARAQLERRFPEAVFRGWRFGEDLAAHYASADCFVFPSRTDTFGNVLLEALAAGLPVASPPGPGAHDLIQDGVNGAIDEDLYAACMRALPCSREHARASAQRYTFQASHALFRSSLVPLVPGRTPVVVGGEAVAAA